MVYITRIVFFIISFLATAAWADIIPPDAVYNRLEIPTFLPILLICLGLVIVVYLAINKNKTEK